MGEQEQPRTMALPDSKSPSLYLTNPTPEERLGTWKLNSLNWGSAIKPDEYLEREAYLMTVPLAKDGGITHWILVDSSLPPNQRPVLASCESLRKPVVVCRNGTLSEGITHGIGSVFCNPQFRGRGYASRMLKELGKKLKEWQTAQYNCPFSILYSDIGKKYYAGYGWHVYPSKHITISPEALPTKSTITAKHLSSADIPVLCEVDVSLLKQQMLQSKSGKHEVALVPDNDTMQWHHLREDFLTSKIFEKSPTIKGAISGAPGSRVWAIWTRSFYGPLKPGSGNTFHILRLVIEDGTASQENADKLEGILQIAQAEALEWQVEAVEFWNPTEVVRELLGKTGLRYKEVDREEESIASLMWYGEGSGKEDEITWVANEKFGWC